MSDDKPGWKRMAFKGNKVWMALDEEQRPLEKDGKVLIKYQVNQDYEYWVHKSSVAPVEQIGRSAGQKKTGDKKSRDKRSDGAEASGDITANLPDNAVLAFTDGASSGNPGPSGIGVLLRYKDKEKCISRFIGQATNNIAELTAIQAALLEIKNKKLPVRIFTDSAYAHGVLTLGWKPKKNNELIQSIQKTMAGFRDLKLIKVKGHAGIPENETADRLAVAAIEEHSG
ncbi:MAG: ribonuclease H [Thermodesulfobacteriota bacterium]